MSNADDALHSVTPSDAALLMTLRVSPSGADSAGIKSLCFVPGGSSSGGGDEDSLLVCGGQGAGEPDMLTLLPMAPQSPGQERGHSIPWFGTIEGFALVPAAVGRGALAHVCDRPEALMILTEGGQLVVHDLRTWQPTPLTLPFMELPPITASRLVPTVSLSLLLESGAALPSPGSVEAAAAAAIHGSGVQHALTLDKVSACSRRLGSGGAAAGGGSSGDAWPFVGGEPPAGASRRGDPLRASAGRHPSSLYFTGHRDGRVRVWDATSQAPLLLYTIPASAGQERLRQVTAVDICPFSGLVMVGHQGGDVRIYQFADSPQTVHRMNVDESRVPYETVAPQVCGGEASETGLLAAGLLGRMELSKGAVQCRCTHWSHGASAAARPATCHHWAWHGPSPPTLPLPVLLQPSALPCDAAHHCCRPLGSSMCCATACTLLM